MKRKKDKKTPHPFHAAKDYSKKAFILTAVIIVAALLRIVCLWQCSSGYDFFFSPQPGTDMYTYHEQALGVLSGSFPQEPFYYNPLYPYFLAVIYWLTSNNIVMVYVFQLLLGLLTCMLVYLISRDMFNRTTAIIAAMLTCLSFDLILYTGILLSATLDTFLCLLSIFLLLKLKKSPTILATIACGIAFGLSVLSRPNTALFAIAGILWLAFTIKDKRLSAIFCLLLTLSMAITISPCTIKNYRPVRLWIITSSL
ncbi:MAG: glycosyltransferase family 39 protein [bacterium]